MIIKNSQKIFQSSKMKIIISKIKIIFQNNKIIRILKLFYFKLFNFNFFSKYLFVR
jgi:hypothetical protein